MPDRFPSDDGLPWGFMNGDRWVELPKTPMLLAELGPPPFAVKLPSGDLRQVVHKPADTPLLDYAIKPQSD